MNNPTEIEHSGTVCSIGDKDITVKITAHPSCAGCYAAGICNSAASNDKYFRLPLQGQFSVGQSVKVTTTLLTGYKALFLGYLLPFLILVASLIVLLASGTGELVAGLSTLVLLAAYFLIIYLFRNKIEKRIKFTLKPA